MRGRKHSRLVSVFAAIYLLAAALLLLSVCGDCFPVFGRRVRNAVLGGEESPVREAFSVLADGLESGEPVKDAVTASIEVLFGEMG